jgi:hypothetical protein
MARKGGFFSPNRKVTGKDKQVASSMSSGSYGGYIDAGESRGFVSPEQADKMIKNPEAYKMRPSETRYLRESLGLPRAQFFSPSGNEIGQIASATTDLSGLVAASDFDKQGYDSFLKQGFGVDSDSSIYKSFPTRIKFDLRQEFKEKQRDFKYQDSSFAPTDTDTGLAFIKNPFQKQLDSPANIPVGDGMIKDSLNQMQQNLKQKYDTMRDSGIMSESDYQKNIKRLLGDKDKVEAPKENILNKVGGFLANVFTGTQPVAAGTLDANQQVSQISERPKLSYVNPDAKTMSLSEIGEAFRPRNLFGYKDKFGRFDDPGSPLARDRAETMQRVAQNFSSPIVGDARSIAQIRADQEARMRENARLRNESFKRGERVGQKSADVTYGTNMLSNPAFGFRSKMTDAQKAQYDKSAKDATEMARTDPSLGNVAMQTFNRISGFFGGPQGSLESIGERQLRLANKEINRPTYQKEAFARKFLGITNEQLKAKNLQQIRANAFARNQAFQNERVQKALERSALRRGENIGTGRDGSPGLGTSGQGLPSNPKGFSGYSRKTSPSTGTGTGTSTSRSRGGISKSTSRGQGGGSSNKSRGGISKSTSRGQGGGSSSRSRGGTGTGSKSNTGSKKASRGTAGSSSRGGTGTGGTKTSRTASKASKSRTGRSKTRCDIRCKIDITSLTNPNLMKDDLATFAYFVQELKGK